MKNSTISFQEIDYLEAARYIVLNWTEKKCRASKLWKVLPRRRKKKGTRPGVTRTGPL